MNYWFFFVLTKVFNDFLDWKSDLPKFTLPLFFIYIWVKYNIQSLITSLKKKCYITCTEIKNIHVYCIIQQKSLNFLGKHLIFFLPSYMYLLFFSYLSTVDFFLFFFSYFKISLEMVETHADIKSSTMLTFRRLNYKWNFITLWLCLRKLTSMCVGIGCVQHTHTHTQIVVRKNNYHDRPKNTVNSNGRAFRDIRENEWEKNLGHCDETYWLLWIWKFFYMKSFFGKAKNVSIQQFFCHVSLGQKRDLYVKMQWNWLLSIHINYITFFFRVYFEYMYIFECISKR